MRNGIGLSIPHYTRKKANPLPRLYTLWPQLLAPLGC